MSSLTKSCIGAATAIWLVGCTKPPLGLQVYPASFECQGSFCQVSFDVESSTEIELSVLYEATLYENDLDARVANSDKAATVGLASGEVSLRPHERKTVARTIGVSGVPNGAKVQVTLAETY